MYAASFDLLENLFLVLQRVAAELTDCALAYGVVEDKKIQFAQAFPFSDAYVFYLGISASDFLGDIAHFAAVA